MLDKIQLKNFFQKNAPLLYKLSCDTLFLLTLFFALTLIAEGILPGIISARIGLYKIVIVICANIFFTLALKNVFLPEEIIKKNIEKEKNKPKKIFLWISSFILLLLVFNALITLPIFLNLFILLISGIIIFYIFKVFRE